MALKGREKVRLVESRRRTWMQKVLRRIGVKESEVELIRHYFLTLIRSEEIVRFVDYRRRMLIVLRRIYERDTEIKLKEKVEHILRSEK